MARNRMPEGRWNDTMARDYFSCQASAHAFGHGPCAGRLVVHHRRPRGMGGSSDPEIHALENLVVLCEGHHREVHAHPDDARACGLIVR